MRHPSIAIQFRACSIYFCRITAIVKVAPTFGALDHGQDLVWEQYGRFCVWGNGLRLKEHGLEHGFSTNESLQKTVVDLLSELRLQLETVLRLGKEFLTLANERGTPKSVLEGFIIYDDQNIIKGDLVPKDNDLAIEPKISDIAVKGIFEAKTTQNLDEAIRINPDSIVEIMKGIHLIREVVNSLFQLNPLLSELLSKTECQALNAKAQLIELPEGDIAPYMNRVARDFPNVDRDSIEQPCRAIWNRNRWLQQFVATKKLTRDSYFPDIYRLDFRKSRGVYAGPSTYTRRFDLDYSRLTSFAMGSSSQCGICDRSIQDLKRSKHIIRHLQPYVCTFAGCSQRKISYSSYRQWHEHEIQYHCTETVWVCDAFCGATFGTKSEFVEHLTKSHSSEFKNCTQLDFAARLCERKTERQITSCSFCKLTGDGSPAGCLHRHVAKHMEDFALSVLSDWYEDVATIIEQTNKDTSIFEARPTAACSSGESDMESEDTKRIQWPAEFARLYTSGERDAAWEKVQRSPGVINIVDKNGDTSLHVASRLGKLDLAGFLLGRNCDLETINSRGREPLREAVMHGHEEMTELLLIFGANCKTESLFQPSLLNLASRYGNKTVVHILLEYGAEVNKTDIGRSTALHQAASNGHESVVRLLLERGADDKEVNVDGEMALHQAASNGYEVVMRLLLERGADVNKVDRRGRMALHRAAKQGHESVVRLLLERGADVNKVDRRGRMALHRAAKQGHESVVRLLLERGADVNKATVGGETALHQAASNGYESVVRLLLESGADINKVDSDGCTALHCAADWGRGSMVNLLTENGADVEARDSEGRTALLVAAFNRHERIVRLLIEKGTSIEKVDLESLMALNLASLGKNEAVIRLLAQKHNDTEVADLETQEKSNSLNKA